MQAARPTYPKRRAMVCAARLAHKCLSRLCLGFPVGMVLAFAPIADAQQTLAVVIRNDPGGEIPTRIQRIAELRADGVRVELRGSLCASACTLFLALDNLCVDPQTRFAFHGPSHYGQPLPPQNFEYWSARMADHYREPIRSWFLNEARFQLDGYRSLTGADLIRYGYAPCN